MKNISIPEPCSEDWNEMTPNEKGAFCQKCALDVYDFTNKSGDEIREILTLNIASPVCMRIQPKQLNQLNNDFTAWKINNRHSYQRAWIFTLFVVFGMTLFSCEEDEEPIVEKFQKVGQSILTEEKSSNTIEFDQKEAQSVEKNTDRNEPAIVDLDEIDEYEIMGGISYEHYPYPEKGEVVVLDEVRTQEVYTTAGIPKMSDDYDRYLIETYPTFASEVDSSQLRNISGLVYPNPASNETTLQVKMPNRGKGEIELFAMNGQKIRTIHSGRLKKGESEFLVDLTNLETGLYVIVVYSGEMKETIQFTKI